MSHLYEKIILPESNDLDEANGDDALKKYAPYYTEAYIDQINNKDEYYSDDIEKRLRDNAVKAKQIVEFVEASKPTPTSTEYGYTQEKFDNMMNDYVMAKEKIENNEPSKFGDNLYARVLEAIPGLAYKNLFPNLEVYPIATSDYDDKINRIDAALTIYQIENNIRKPRNIAFDTTCQYQDSRNLVKLLISTHDGHTRKTSPSGFTEISFFETNLGKKLRAHEVPRYVIGMGYGNILSMMNGAEVTDSSVKISDKAMAIPSFLALYEMNSQNHLMLTAMNQELKGSIDEKVERPETFSSYDEKDAYFKQVNIRRSHRFITDLCGRFEISLYKSAQRLPEELVEDCRNSKTGKVEYEKVAQKIASLKLGNGSFNKYYDGTFASIIRCTDLARKTIEENPGNDYYEILQIIGNKKLAGAALSANELMDDSDDTELDVQQAYTAEEQDIIDQVYRELN